MEIHVQDENGNILKTLLDTRGVVERTIGKHKLPESCCWKFIDIYGDTTFNWMQIKTLIGELEKITQNTDQVGDNKFLGELISLSNESLSHPHQYLKFVGD